MSVNQELKNYSIDPSLYVFPVSLTRIFSNRNPCALEIGFGEGEFILDLALKRPDWNFVAIEIKRGRFKKALKKAGKKGAENLKLLNIEAEIALNQVFAKNSFREVYINFPDPWPKTRHFKHRLFNQNIINQLSLVTEPSGKIRIKTDHPDYNLHISSEFKKSRLFNKEYSKTGFETEKGNEIETKFEKTFKKEGKKIFFATFTNMAD